MGWTTAGALFYLFVYRPEEEEKRKRHEKVAVVIEKKSTIGKYRGSDDV